MFPGMLDRVEQQIVVSIGLYIHSLREAMLLELVEPANKKGLRSFEMFVTICQSVRLKVIQD